MIAAGFDVIKLNASTRECDHCADMFLHRRASVCVASYTSENGGIRRLSAEAVFLCDTCSLWWVVRTLQCEGAQ